MLKTILMGLQLKVHQGILIFLGFIILSVTSCVKPGNQNHYKYGIQSRLVQALIPMQCTEDNLAVYNEYLVYRLGSDDYKLIGFSDSIGSTEKVFAIQFDKYGPDIRDLENARISICYKQKNYIGLPVLKGMASYPPECHFLLNYDSRNCLKVDQNGILKLGSVKFVSLEEYKKRLGVGE